MEARKTRHDLVMALLLQPANQPEAIAAAAATMLKHHAEVRAGWMLTDLISPRAATRLLSLGRYVYDKFVLLPSIGSQSAPFFIAKTKARGGGEK